MTVAAAVGIAVAALYDGSSVPMTATIAGVAVGVLSVFVLLVRERYPSAVAADFRC